MVRTKIILTAAGISLGILLGIQVQPVISGDNIYQQVKKFSDVLNLTVKNYVDEVESTDLVAAGIRGMLETLNDPHSIYIPPKQKKKIDEDFKGSFDGIGISFEILRDTITVVTPIIGGPSEKLGILAGDKIVKIENESAVGLDSDEVPEKLKGPRGTTVAISIKRSGVSDLIDFEIMRDKIPIYSVDAAFLIDGSDVGYIRVNRFAVQTHNELRKAAVELREQGMKRMVLDLRYNPGGYLDQAYRIADEFIEGGHKLVYTKGRREEFDNDYFASEDGDFEQVPLIVLINASSASASEIVAGAIQDLDRGLIVGETSFGKGLVQQQYPLSDGSAFRITTSKYYTPSGRLIQRPYEDKEKYYNLEGRLDLEEGANIDHEGEIDTTRPAYETRSGRIVYGGGGIVPDYIVKSDTVTLLYRHLRNRNVFRLFTDSYMSRHGQELRDTYANNFSAFFNKFRIDASMVVMLRKLADEQNVEWDEEDYTKDEQSIKVAMKSQIAKSIWNVNESVAVLLENDRQLQKALELFPEARKIARLQ